MFSWKYSTYILAYNYCHEYVIILSKGFGTFLGLVRVRIISIYPISSVILKRSKPIKARNSSEEQ